MNLKRLRPILSIEQRSKRLSRTKNCGEEYKENDKESKRIKTLLDIMGDEPLTAKELMEVLNLKHTNSFLQNYLSPAIRLGFVKMTHPENPKHRNQRYYKVRKQ